MECLAKNIRPRDIVTRKSLENAAAVVAASGGSTNAALHLPAIAAEAERNGVDLSTRGFTAEMLAEALLDRLDGIKARTIDPQAQLQAARVQISLINAVLQA